MPLAGLGRVRCSWCWTCVRQCIATPLCVGQRRLIDGSRRTLLSPSWTELPRSPQFEVVPIHVYRSNTKLSGRRGTARRLEDLVRLILWLTADITCDSQLLYQVYSFTRSKNKFPKINNLGFVEPRPLQPLLVVICRKLSSICTVNVCGKYKVTIVSNQA